LETLIFKLSASDISLDVSTLAKAGAGLYTGIGSGAAWTVLCPVLVTSIDSFRTNGGRVGGVTADPFVAPLSLLLRRGGEGEDTPPPPSEFTVVEILLTMLFILRVACGYILYM
jgi:hypothetical protein